MNANTHLDFQLFNQSNALLMQPDLSMFEALIHSTAHFIACFSVTVSLLICMAAILFSCMCLLELLIQFANETMHYLKTFKGEGESKIF